MIMHKRKLGIYMNFSRVVILGVCLVMVGCQGQKADPLNSYENQTAEKIYQQAKSLEAEGKSAKSADAYAALRAFHPESILVKRSLVESINVNMKGKKYEEAVLVADKIINWYPASNIAADAYYLKGKALIAKHRSWLQKQMNIPYSNLSRENLENAKQAFMHLVKDFPNSKYTNDSNKQINQINKYLAEHQVSIAKYYLKAGNYSAAMARAKMAITLDSRVKNNAKKIIVACNRRTGRGADW